ncbi:LysM domain-containing protein [Caldanaerobius fijiensis DSM 17918]|uniref:LysM domain-containing protein n=1 Tax=Caldanaerobius fijiensis DSM 17918 TaxID=1121256 RepID=A0A1M5BCF4_9THEO|nr:LysM peptidoglycan-binding domain-containing protein [Caldanaerobius fijiensis]SHF40194.1 LysM domain-containing protein [Caldanaerobius fijiensis DSM 17918]
MLKSKKARVFLATVSLSLTLVQTAYAGTYKVVAGDSLYKIGNLFNTTASTIMKYNNLKDTYIYPGQVLYVPSDTYTVKAGDSLYLIAKKYGISLYSLRKANNKWDDYIYPGQVLNIPGSTPTTGSSYVSDNGNSVYQEPSRGSVYRGVITYSLSDLDLLARLITAEADGEPYEAKVGVGAVVINRVKDYRFPNTISDVIYEKTDGYYQFTPVENGWINKPASEEAKKAAYDALHGSDPTHGALFYFDDSATNSWLWSQPIAARIGRMVFTYLK